MILGLVEQKADATLAELREALAERGIGVGMGTLWRFFERRKITLKKSRRTRMNKAVPTS